MSKIRRKQKYIGPIDNPNNGAKDDSKHYVDTPMFSQRYDWTRNGSIHLKSQSPECELYPNELNYFDDIWRYRYLTKI